MKRDINSPIVARCTPQGSGAIALIRISGQQAVEVTTGVAQLSSRKALDTLPTHTIHHGFVVDTATQKKVDEVLFLLMRGPRTFTGDDTVEITCHNNEFIITAIISLLCKNGARMALPGEFTQQAFANGKLDFSQAEAIHELITAPSQLAVEKSLAQLHGSLSHELAKIEDALVKLQCMVEASFEFLDEEQRDINFDQTVREQLAALINTVTELLTTQSHAQQIKDGIRIALIGSVNAGKSTLLNMLIGRERALVSDVAGTTRDTVEATIVGDNYFWTFIDTAGIRITHDQVEKAGIERSYAEAAQADCIIAVIDQSRELKNQEAMIYKEIADNYHDKVIWVASKADCVKHSSVATFLRTNNYHAYTVSQGASHNVLRELKQKISEKITQLVAHNKTTFILSQRQITVLQNLSYELAAIAEKTAEQSLAYELIAYDITRAIELTSQLTGHNVSEKVMDTVFRSFCVGK